MWPRQTLWPPDSSVPKRSRIMLWWPTRLEGLKVFFDVWRILHHAQFTLLKVFFEVLSMTVPPAPKWKDQKAKNLKGYQKGYLKSTKMTRLEEKKIFDLIIFNSHFYGFSDIFSSFLGGRDWNKSRFWKCWER